MQRGAVTIGVLVLAFQTMLLMTVLRWHGDLELQGPNVNDDAREYFELSQGSIREGLTAYRTLGYPIFLRIVQRIFPKSNLAILPHVQWAMHLVCVVIFYLGLQSVLKRPWISLAITSMLLYSNTMLAEGACMLTDAPASSLAIASMGFVLFLATERRRWWVWGGLGISVFLAYQMRPSYLFLLVLCPLLVFLVRGLVVLEARWWRRGARVALMAAALVWVPFLAYCGLRGALVGDFGLVAFDGYNLAGVAVQFLTPNLADRLPEDTKPLAERVLALQQWTAAGKLPEIYGGEDPQSLKIRDLKNLLREERLPQASRPYFDDIEYTFGVASHIQKTLRKEWDEQFRDDRDIWAVSVPAAQELAPGSDNLAINRSLKKLSLAILKQKPVPFVKYVAKMFALMAVLTVINSYALLGLGVVLVVFASAWQALWMIRRWRGHVSAEMSTSVRIEADLSQAGGILTLLGLSFAFGQTILLAVVAQPLRRYTDASGVFLPAAGMVAVIMLSSRFWAFWLNGRKTGASKANAHEQTDYHAALPT